MEAERRLGRGLSIYIRLSGPGWLQRRDHAGRWIARRRSVPGRAGRHQPAVAAIGRDHHGRGHAFSAISYVTLSTGERPFECDQFRNQSGCWLGLADRDLHGQHDLVHAAVQPLLRRHWTRSLVPWLAAEACGQALRCAVSLLCVIAIRIAALAIVMY